jgi:hypothetical protein
MTSATPTRYRGVVVQAYESGTEAEDAVRALIDAGFTPDEISVVAQDEARATAAAGDPEEEIAAGAGIGAVTGGALGGIIGLLVGAAAVTLPGIGVVIAGPLAAALGGAGLGAITGGIAGGLTSIGVSEEEARYYGERYEAGEILVVVAAGDREPEARRILGSGGAPDMPLV